MDIETLAGLVAVIALVLANGFFVATEFAIVAARHSRLEQLRNEGVPGAGAALKIVDHLDQYIAACQFGITLASLALGWVGEPAIAHIFLGFSPGLMTQRPLSLHTHLPVGSVSLSSPRCILSWANSLRRVLPCNARR